MRENVSFMESFDASSFRIWGEKKRDEEGSIRVSSKRARHAALFYSFLKVHFVLFSAYIHWKLCVNKLYNGYVTVYIAPSTCCMLGNAPAHKRGIQKTHIEENIVFLCMLVDVLVLVVQQACSGSHRFSLSISARQAPYLSIYIVLIKSIFDHMLHTNVECG